METLWRLIMRMRWISLEKRIPIEGACVIVSMPNAHMPVRERYAYWDNYRRFGKEDFGPGFVCWRSGKPLDNQISHWMPTLPLPFRKK